jgi:protein SCO1/2
MKIKQHETGFFRPLLLMVLVLLTCACDQDPKAAQTEGAFMMPEAADIAAFKLSHLDRGVYDIEDARGNWSLLFFGYTHCPDVCPTELFMLAEMMRGIEQDPDAIMQSPQVVFVSVDPDRDSLQHLQQYASYYHPGFLGVTSAQSTIDRLCQSLGVFYERVYYQDGKVIELDTTVAVPAGLEGDYLINHSASIFLVNPAGKLHAIFTPPHDPNTMIRDLAAIQASWRS